MASTRMDNSAGRHVGAQQSTVVQSEQKQQRISSVHSAEQCAFVASGLFRTDKQQHGFCRLREYAAARDDAVSRSNGGYRPFTPPSAARLTRGGGAYSGGSYSGTGASGTRQQRQLLEPDCAEFAFDGIARGNSSYGSYGGGSITGGDRASARPQLDMRQPIARFAFGGYGGYGGYSRGATPGYGGYRGAPSYGGAASYGGSRELPRAARLAELWWWTRRAELAAAVADRAEADTIRRPGAEAPPADIVGGHSSGGGGGHSSAVAVDILAVAAAFRRRRTWRRSSLISSLKSLET